MASGWIESAVFPDEVDFFVTERIQFTDTNEDATPDVYSSLTLLELDSIDFAYWHQFDDLADEDYRGPDYDDDTPEEEWIEDNDE